MHFVNLIFLEVAHLWFKQIVQLGTCNPSYSGGREQEDRGSKLARANSSWDPILKKPITKNGWATQEAQITIAVQSQSGQNSLQDPILKKPITKKAW
jgi:hypothetical protein